MEFDYTRVICQKGALGRVHERTQALNDAAPVKTFTKVVNGEEKPFLRKPKALPGSVEATMERIVKNYVRHHHRLLKNVGESAFEAGMPGMLTCRQEIAGQRSISEKTAYNHLRKLRELGLITRYRFRGSRHAFEIWIDPVLLFQPERVDMAAAPSCPQPALTVEKPVGNQLSKTPSFLAIPANFTAYKVTVTHSNYETENKADGIVHGDAPNEKHGDEKYGNPERQQPETAPEWQTGALSNQSHSDLGTGGAGAAGKTGNVDNAITAARRPGPTAVPAGAGQRIKARMTKKGLDAHNATNRTPQQHRAILEGYLSSFWQYARQSLYPGRTFADYEEPLILSAIRRGVYRNFEPILTEKEWDQYQTELYKQIDLAAGYYGRHQDKWVPAPYAQMREGAGYFDRENGRGFIVTRDWLKENQRLYRQTYVTQRISLAVRHLQLHRAEKAPKTLQSKSYIDAYRHLEAQIGKYGEQAQDRFRRLAATIGNRKPKLTPGFTKIFKK